MRTNKRAYHGKRVYRLDVKKILETVRSRGVILATDVAKKEMVSAIELDDGELVALVKWTNPTDLRVFVELARSLASHSARVAHVHEPTGTYGDPLRHALQQVGIPVFQASPKRVHDLREAYDGTPSSHDPKAARIIADCHRRGLSSPWTERSVEQNAQLRCCEIYAQAKEQLIGRLEARLARHWPEVCAQLRLDSATLLQLLTTYGGPHEIAANLPAARSLVRSTGGRWLSADKLEAVLDGAKTSVGVPTTPEEREEVVVIARELLEAEKELKTHQKALYASVESIKCVQNIIAVTGPATAAVLYAALGDPVEYPSAGAYIKAAGLNLRERSSGTKKGELSITKRGPGIVRQRLYFTVMRLVQSNAHFHIWHERKKARSGPKQGKKSIIALSRRLMGALWHVGRGSKWAPDRLFNLGETPVAP